MKGKTQTMAKKPTRGVFSLHSECLLGTVRFTMAVNGYGCGRVGMLVVGKRHAPGRISIMGGQSSERKTDDDC